MTDYPSLYSPDSWTERAKCGGRPTSDYDVSTILGDAHLHRTAKDIEALTVTALVLCHGCPVKPECAQLALDTQAAGMVYAGIAISNSNPARAYAELARIAASPKERKK